MSKWLMNYGEYVGLSHLPNNIPCQDKALCKSSKSVNVAVLSDGCGSSLLAHYGSEIVVDCLTNLFINKFDELYGESNQEIVASRKLIIDTIGQAYEKFIKDNKKMFDDVKSENSEKYNEFMQKSSRTDFDFECDCLNATALFVAVKGKKYIIGQIGDGIIGGLFKNYTKILMEEEKTGQANHTIYPISIYNLAKKDPKWYNISQFVLKTPKFVTYENENGETEKADLEGFFLMSDGVDGLLDKTVAFEKKFSKGVGKFINKIITDSKESQITLNEEFLPLLTKYSNSKDDCSLAFLIKEDAVSDNPTNLIKYYPREDFDERELFEINSLKYKAQNDNYVGKLFDEELDELLPLENYNDILTDSVTDGLVVIKDFAEPDTSVFREEQKHLSESMVLELQNIKTKIATICDVSYEYLNEYHLPKIYDLSPLYFQITKLHEIYNFLMKVKNTWGNEYKYTKQEKSTVHAIADFKFPFILINSKSISWF